MNIHPSKVKWAGLGLIMAVILLLPSSAFAQRQDGTISGEVRDPAGAAVPNIKVTATNDGTGVSLTTVTTDVGAFVFPNVQVGSYTVKIEAPGFATYTRHPVEVNAARVTEVIANLSLGTAAETIEVQSGAEVIQLSSSQISNTFETRAVSDLPTFAGANASVLNLAAFLPNTTTQLGGTSGRGGSIGGLRGRENSFIIDGANNNDPSVSVSLQPVIGEAVAEFSLTTNQFSAEYGNAAGGQFNIVTKSGTNNLHGSAFWSGINRNLNAADNQEKALIALGTLPDKKRYDLNTMGGTVGGPIIRNKLFLFGAFQYSTQGQQPSAPSALSFFGSDLARLNSLAANQQVKDLLAQFPTATAQAQICGPNKNQPCVATLSGGQVFPLGIVTAIAPNFYTIYDYVVNPDLNLTKHQLRWRYSKNRLRQPQFGNFPQPQFASSVATDARKGVFSDVWSVTNRLVNNFNANFTRYQQSFPLTGVAATYPTVIFTGDLTGLQVGPANNFPQHRLVNQYQMADSMSWTRGRHTLKYGGDYRWITSPSVFLSNERGQYSYRSLNELISDLVPSNANATLQGIGDGSFAGNSQNYALYIQDDIKITPRLTVNLGLRYEFFGLPKDARKQALNSVSDLPGTPLIFRVPKEDRNDFGPRVGFAWDPTGSAKWAVRGGFGISYDTVPYNFATNGAPPQRQAVLQPPTACQGTLSAPPSWCASQSGFLAGNAMKLAFIPPTNQPLARSLTGNLIADQVQPKVMSWSLGVQRELMRNTSIEIRYVGTRAVELPAQVQLNSITAFEKGALPLPTYFNTSQIPASVPATAPNLQQFFILTPQASSTNRRYASAGFTDLVTWFGPIGNSRYHSGAIDFNHRFSHGFLGRANWTYSRNQDNSTNDLFTSTVNPRRPENAYDLQREWGRSALDVRHKVALSWVYDIPKAGINNAVAKIILHGWQYNGTWLWQLGQPITPISAFDSNGNGDIAGDRVIINPAANNLRGTDVNLICRDALTGATSVGPTLTDSVAGSCGGRTSVVGYVASDPGAHFVRAGFGAVTNSGRNIVNSPGFNVWNMAFFKNTAIREHYQIQFRFEAYNVFNHPNFTLGEASVFGTTLNATSQSYNVVSSPLFLDAATQFNGGKRQIQLGLKVSF